MSMIMVSLIAFYELAASPMTFCSLLLLNSLMRRMIMITTSAPTKTKIRFKSGFYGLGYFE
jgi:hypothetical protein